MKFKLEITMDNAAFDDGQAHDEVARILSEAARKIESGAWAVPLLDSNGNNVGKTQIQ